MTTRSLSIAAASTALALLVVPSALPAHAHDTHHRASAAAATNEGPLDPAERARYETVGRAIVEALARGDLAAFRALHTDAGWDASDEWWRSLLAPQRESFGSVVRAWGPVRGAIRCGEFTFREEGGGVTVVVRFERDVGAALTFTLDTGGKIAGGKVFVSESLATVPPEGLPVLWTRPEGP